MTANNCPCCGEGTLIPKEAINSFDYKEHNITVPLRYKVCNCCESEIAEPDDLKFNKQQSILAKQKIDNQYVPSNSKCPCGSSSSNCN